MGLKFRRQHPIEPYVVDFFCEEKKLIVEVDGSIHYQGNRPVLDKIRQEKLESLGYRVLRVTTTDVLENLQGVLDAIRSYVNNASLD